MSRDNLLVSLENVTVGFNQVTAISEVNLEIRAGTSMALIGPNGGGKTTLLKVILGLIKPTRGRVRYHDLKQHQIGYVPQETSIDPGFPATALDVVLMGRYPLLGLMHPPSKKDKEIARRMLERVGLSSQAERPLGSLSGGQKQRMMIARALAAEPRLLLLDEPTSGADVAAKDRFYTLVSRLQEELGIAVIAASHELQVVPRFVEDVACIYKTLHLHSCPSGMWDEEQFQRIYGTEMEALLHGKVPHRMVKPHDAASHRHGDPRNTRNTPTPHDSAAHNRGDPDKPQTDTSSPSGDPARNARNTPKPRDIHKPSSHPPEESEEEE